jgi:hypothetical protein
VAVRGPADPIEIVREVAGGAGAALTSSKRSRVTVEDAFVSMVRQDLAKAEQQAA